MFVSVLPWRAERDTALDRAAVVKKVRKTRHKSAAHGDRKWHIAGPLVAWTVQVYLAHKKRYPPGPYSRLMHRAIWWSLGGGRFS